MVVCDFCYAKLFSNPRWLPGNRHRITHHTSTTKWKESVSNPCTICTLLLEHVSAAVSKSEAGSASTPSAQASHDGKGANSVATHLGPSMEISKADYDCYVREHTVEEVLLTWLATRGAGIDALMPLYEVTLQDGGARKAWLLKFQPCENQRLNGRLLELPSQTFDVYGSDYDKITTQRPSLEGSTDSKTTFQQIKTWIETCESEDHAHCRHLHQKRLDDTYVPTRLLDVGAPGAKSSGLRLVETRNMGVEKYFPYITLSYKWGYNPSCLLEKHNRKAYLQQIPWDSLPVTFRDAVDATRRLNIRYLWIDALCLVQKDTEEWLRESPRMQEIYANSYLSLAAVSADNCEQGLFRKRRRAGVPPSVGRIQLCHQSAVCQVVRDDFWKGELLSEPLYARGWVLQERMLAPRILHFHRRQIFWQCPSLTASEGVPEGLSTIIDDERQDELRWRQLVHRPEHSFTIEQEVDMHNIWRFLVGSFTNCDLTKSRDKLMAIAGISKQMKVAFNGEQYIAGLWRRHLVEQLAWRVVKFKKAIDESYRAPSWAWASVDGVVSVPARVQHKPDYIMTIQDGGVNLVLEKSENEVGTLLFGSLTVESEIYRLAFSASSLDETEWSWAATGEETRHAWCRFYPDKPLERDQFNCKVNEERDEPSLSETRISQYRLVCSAAMLMYERESNDIDEADSFSGYALALKPQQAGQAKIYCRIGLIQFRNLSWNALEKAQKRKVKKEGEVAPSENIGNETYIITLL